MVESDAPTKTVAMITKFLPAGVQLALAICGKNNPNIYWTYYTKPRRDFFVNHPLLKGFVDRTFDKPFEASFEPIHMAHVQAVKIMKKTAKETDLLNIYNIWVQKF